MVHSWTPWEAIRIGLLEKSDKLEDRILAILWEDTLTIQESVLRERAKRIIKLFEEAEPV